ncbi:MAG: Type II secretion system protein D precursor [Deltaproteobacteria bacterium ADurb.BinA179]|nr:MAG: Type II secretion system protein D precursor [Deltaproteobacteria bacterium ADurb.BinA179]
MITRHIVFFTIAIALLLGSSGAWGARLMQGQAPQRPSEETLSLPEAQGPPREAPAQAPGTAFPMIDSGSVEPEDMLPPPDEQRRARGPQRISPDTQGRPSVPQGLPSQPARTDQPRQIPGTEEAGTETQDGKQYVTMDFDGVDIKVFVKFIADITGKNFILDDKVAGKVTVISPRKMSLDEAYQVFLSVLDVNGYGTVTNGGVTKIVRAADAITKSLDTVTGSPQKREDVLVTQIIQLKHVDANDMKTLFTPLLSRGSSQLLAYPQSNVLIITDTRSNIKKITEILDIIDKSGFGQEFRIFSLSYASAIDLSTKLGDILSEDSTDRAQRIRSARTQGAVSQRSSAKIIPYERTNSLIVLASAIEMTEIASLIKKLDIPTPSGKEDIHVYYLQYANAEDLAKVLTDMPAPDKASAAISPEGVPGARGGFSSSQQKDFKISFDKETNSLIVYADPDAYQSILETIKYLDIPRKQVYVKAIIMEVNTNEDFKVGVEWSAFEDFTYDGGERTGGVFGRTGSNFITNLSDLPSGALFGVVGDAITINRNGTEITFPNMTSFINAMAQDTKVNILSTPQIITLDNKEAEITVGANVPYVTREDTDTTNIDRTIRTYDYRDVGVMLKFTPQINQQGWVRLELFQENTSLVAGQGADEFAPTTLKRSAKTTVTVKDGATMVIGGLIGDSVTFGENRVPLLGRIPLLGYLFKSKTKKYEKTNLYIFLTPQIIDTEQKAEDLYRKKYGEMSRKHNDEMKGRKKDVKDENPEP